MIAITGAAGQLGRSVAMALAERCDVSRITLGTRDPLKIADLAARGFNVAAADFDRPDTMVRAFEGADVVLVICGNAPNEVRVLQHRAAIDSAKRAGVKRLVYTSFVNPSRDSLFPFAKVHADSEDHLRASGLNYTMLRNNHYFENLNDALARAQVNDVLSLPGAAGKVAYLSRVDIAVATAAVLADTNHDSRTYQLTGSEALDLDDVAAVVSKAWGRKIVAQDMPAEEYRQILERRKLPPFAIDAQVGIRLASGANEYAEVTEDVARLIGHPPQTFADHLAVRMQKTEQSV